MKKYLSDIISELPTGCCYSKGGVGVGGTTLAIEGNKPYIICVPYVSIIKNKMNQYPNERFKKEIFGFYKGVTKTELQEYLKSTDLPKIMVTYDSLEKLMECIIPEYYFLLIDEYHILFNAYSYRRDAAQTVLRNFKKFQAYTFMTATPLESEFILEELKDIPIVTQKWENTMEVSVQSIYCDNVEASTIKLINAFLSGQEEGNAYIFVNSVEFIKNLIKKANLTEENCRVIYSKNNKTVLPIRNGETYDEPKKINLLTSTVYEGCDLKDEQGRCIVVSDASKSQTLVDISTQLHQISGRIRNSKFNNVIAHLYNTTRYNNDLTYEEFREKNIKNIESTKGFVEYFNNAPIEYRKKIKEMSADSYTQFGEDYTLVYDPNLAKIDMFNFKILKGIYRYTINLDDEYKAQGFKMIKGEDHSIKVNVNEKVKTFIETLKEVRKELENKYTLTTPKLNTAVLKYPWLPKAIEVLGFERMATLNYNITKIKDELLSVSSNSCEMKVVLKLDELIKVGNWYPTAVLKKYIADAYEIAESKKTVKGSAIKDYFDVEEKTKRIDGKVVIGYTIFSKKYQLINK